VHLCLLIAASNGFISIIYATSQYPLQLILATFCFQMLSGVRYVFVVGTG